MINIPDSVFPRDENGRLVCPVCRKELKDCACPSFDPAKPKTDLFSPSIRLDKSGRKGKLVTLVTGLPSDEAYLKDLAKILKVKTGSGGTFYTEAQEGVIEIQGDQRKIVTQVLGSERFRLD